MNDMNKIIEGAYRCPRCGGAKWKMEHPNVVYCLNNVKGNLCCYHLGQKQAKKIYEAVKAEDQRRELIKARIRRKYGAIDERF